MKGYAPGWQVRCPKCSLTLPAADLGFVFIGKHLIGKERRLGWCQQCHRLRWLIVESTTDTSAAAGRSLEESKR